MIYQFLIAVILTIGAAGSKPALALDSPWPMTQTKANGPLTTTQKPAKNAVNEPKFMPLSTVTINRSLNRHRTPPNLNATARAVPPKSPRPETADALQGQSIHDIFPSHE